MNTAIRRHVNKTLGPKWFQVVRIDPDTQTQRIVCEHRNKWAAALCVRLKPRRGVAWFTYQCRSCWGCYD